MDEIYNGIKSMCRVALGAKGWGGNPDVSADTREKAMRR